MSEEKFPCPWGCGHYYEAVTFNRKVEDEHLVKCPVFRNAPVAEVKNGKQFVRHPECENILVERPPLIQ